MRLSVFIFAGTLHLLQRSLALARRPEANKRGQSGLVGSLVLAMQVYGLALVVMLAILFIVRGENDRWVVFESDRNGIKDLFIIGVDGTGLRRLTSHAGPDSHPSWSPDGRWIVFESYRNRNWDIYRVRPFGTDLAPIKETIGIERFPRWEGKNIVYMGQIKTQFTDISMNLVGQPVDHSIVSEESWVVSPDGQWVIATYLEHTKYHFYLVNLATDGRQLITLHDGNDTEPSWSYDGEWLVLSSDIGGNWDVYMMRPDGSARTRITSHPERDLRPSLSPRFDRAFHPLVLIVLSMILINIRRVFS
jgi:Tol biopolymer transport system component